MKEKESDATLEDRSGWKVALAAAVIVFAAFAVYQNSLSGAFVLDDESAITKNDSIRHLWPPWAALSPPAGSTTGGRPLVNLSFAINYAIGGARPWGYHLGNVVIHLCASMALFGVARRTLRNLGAQKGAMASRWKRDASPLALAIAVLWAVHPLLTASVSYVSQRAEVMMSLFYLLTLYTFIRGAEASPKIWLSLSAAACGLGLASKEVMVTAPVAVLLYDRAFVAGTIREAWRRRRIYYIALGAGWLLFAFFIGRGLSQRSVGYGAGVSGWNYLLTECEAVVRYLRLTVWPHPLVFDYGPVFLRSAERAAPCALVLAAILAAVALALWRKPALGFVAAWFFLILAPTSSVVPVALQPIAENRAYLPLAAVVTLVVLGLHAWQGRRGLMAGAVFAFVLGGVTVSRNRDFQTAETLWRDTVAKRPENPRAHNNLGFVLYEQGQVTEPAACYERALQLDPDYADAHSNYGALLFKLGRVEEALAHERRAVELRPGLAIAHNNLAAALIQVGLFAEALDHAEQAVKIDHGTTGGHFQAGNALLRSGRAAEAIPHYEAEIRLRPTYVNVWANLGAARYMLGRREMAVGDLEQALSLQSDFLDARVNLVSVLFDLGRFGDVIEHSHIVLSASPGNIRVRFLLAKSLAAVGRSGEAETEYEAVLRAKPDFQPAQAELAALRTARGAVDKK